MVEIPEHKVDSNTVAAWFEAKEALNKAKAREILLRMELFKGFFPTPREGTNTKILEDGTGIAKGLAGWQLKATHVINRSVDEGALTTLTPMFREKNIPVDTIFKVKRELSVAAYRELTAEELQLVDQALTIKDGTPGMELVKPSNRKPKT